MKKRNFLILLSILSISLSSFGQYSISETEQNYAIENDNHLSIMLSDVLVRRLSVEYEHVLGDGKMSFNVPVSVTLSPYGDLWSDEVHWWLGMGIKFYPTGQGILRYFLGAEFRLISVAEENYYWEGEYPNENYYSNFENYLNTAFLINNGLIYSPTNNFFVSANIGFGFLSRSADTNLEQLVPYATPSFRLGFKF
ncbi:MAG: hypothetical protein JW857_00365 [Bacteroidales bacterium]|nr:hypothetical protein [Bacteroidales bacterium]